MMLEYPSRFLVLENVKEQKLNSLILCESCNLL